MGDVDELDDPLLLLSIGTPCWIVTQLFGKNDMFWYRLLERLGRNSLVCATVRDPDRLPVHLAADEHHADWRGERGSRGVPARPWVPGAAGLPRGFGSFRGCRTRVLPMC